MTAELNKKIRRKGGMHISTGVAGAVAYLIVLMSGAPQDMHAEVTAALTTLVSWIFNEIADPK